MSRVAAVLSFSPKSARATYRAVAGGARTVVEIAGVAGIPTKTAGARLSELCRVGIVRRNGCLLAGPWRPLALYEVVR